jgi:hypothetical protein
MEQPPAPRSAMNGALVNRLWRRAQQPGCVRLDRARALLDRHARLTGELPLADLLRRGHGIELPASGPLFLATRPALSSSPGRGAAMAAAEPPVPATVTVNLSAPLAGQPSGAAEGPFPLLPAASAALPGTQTAAQAAVGPGGPRPDPVPAGFPVPARLAPLPSGPARTPADTSAPELAPVVRPAPAVPLAPPVQFAPPARPTLLVRPALPAQPASSARLTSSGHSAPVASTTGIDAADASSTFASSVLAITATPEPTGLPVARPAVSSRRLVVRTGRRVPEQGWPRATSERSGAVDAASRPPLPVVRDRAAPPGTGWPGAGLPRRPVVPAPGGQPRTAQDRAAEPAGPASRRADRPAGQREPARPAGPPIDLDRIVSTVQRRLTHQLAIERERRGMRR